MRNAVIAVLASAAFHALLAAAVAFGLSLGSAPEASVSLDLSRVELSFAEREDDAAAAAAAPDSPPPSRPPSPVRPDSPDVPEVAFDAVAPRPDDPAIPEVPESAPEVDAPPPGREAEEASATPSDVAPRQAEVDAPPRPRASIRPDYPVRARERGEQGDVVLEISVDEEGGVDGVSVVSSSGHAELDEAAVRAARRARFAPAKAGGSPVASVARLTLSFRLR